MAITPEGPRHRAGSVYLDIAVVAQGLCDLLGSKLVASMAGVKDPGQVRKWAEGRHSFAAIALSEAGGDILSVSRAMGHARPSITLDRYGHLAPAGLAPLMAKIDELAARRVAHFSQLPNDDPAVS